MKRNSRKQYPIYIGIDPGTTTGFAIWDAKEQALVALETHTFFTALDRILEDANERKWFGARSDEKQQGAGSIKRECKIWKEVLDGFDVPSRFCHPIKNGTKMNNKQFQSITGWPGQTNSHNRDAAMLVYQRL